MKLQIVQQRDFGRLSGPYDAIISASGYESRARFVAEQLNKNEVVAKKKFAFAFKEHVNECARIENDEFFTQFGYKLLPCSGRSTIEAHKCFEVALALIKKIESPKILVDISCMTRAWYGEIVHGLLALSQFHKLQVDFAYTPAEFSLPAGDYPPNRVAGPIPGFVGLTFPNKPTSLGIGLGYPCSLISVRQQRTLRHSLGQYPTESRRQKPSWIGWVLYRSV
jgi:hypothetical protein